MRNSSRVLFSLVSLVIAVFFALTPITLHADAFTFSFTGSLFSGSGTFTATEVGNSDIYNITAVTGTVTAIGSGPSAITALLGNNVFQGNDNKLIYPGTGILGSKFFDSDGVSFSLANKNDVNLNDTLGFENAVDGKPNRFDITEFDIVDVSKVAVTPEPSALLLFGTGLLFMAGLFFRQKNRCLSAII
jgi:hypothetical protein